MQGLRAALISSCAVLAITAVPAAAATPDIDATPRLTPAFDPDVHDYVSRCGKDHPLRLRVRAPRGGSAAVDAGRRRSGSFRKRAELRSGQQAVISLHDGGSTETYHVRCLPAGFPRWTATRSGRTQAGHYFVTPVGPGRSRFPVIFDRNGVPVWWYVASTATFDFSLLPDGNVAWSRYYSGDQFGWRSSQAYVERTLTGRRVRRIRTVGSPTDIHDLQQLRNGNYLVITYRERSGVDLTAFGGPSDATVVDSEIQELTPKGRRVWRWNSKDHVSLEETRAQGPIPLVELADGRELYDPTHLNSVEVNGDELVLSMRSVAAVYGIDRESGKVRWKLGGTERAGSLDFVGDERASFGGQHDARILPDGTLTIFDNATGRNLPPRAVRYRLDHGAGTATLLDQIVDPDVPLSRFAGGARRLPGGHWAISWGGEPAIGEYTASGRQVFALDLAKEFFSYRAIPVARGRLSTAALRRAMDEQYPRKR